MYGDNDNNEELYIFKDDVIRQIQPHLDSIVERYYKQKWMKRRMKFGRCFIAAEKPTIIVDKSFNGFQKIVRDLFKTLHEKEPSYHTMDIQKIIKNVEKEMDDKIKGFSRSAWDMVKMTDGVGVVSIAQQKKLMNKRRKSAKLKIKTDDKSNEIVDAVNNVSTPSSPSKRKRKVRIIEAQKNKNNNNDNNDENK